MEIALRIVAAVLSALWVLAGEDADFSWSSTLVVPLVLVWLVSKPKSANARLDAIEKRLDALDGAKVGS